MVSKRYYLDEQSVPPPMDESWWEAVLAEEEMQGAYVSRATRHHIPLERPDLSSGMLSGGDNGDVDPSANIRWDQVINLYEQDQVTQLDVTGCNRGGLLVSGPDLQGFVPVSHLIQVPCNESDLETWLEQYIGQAMCLKVIECDQERGRIVFSERAAQSVPGSRKHLLNTLRPGGCISGVVTNITDFGVFVDLGGVEGLVHVSEISWGRVHHPSDILELGQRVDVYVLNVDQERARVGLSLKRLHANPWETVQQRYHPGQIVQATVTSLVPFGAFARLEEGLDGLIHISEFAAGEDRSSRAPRLQEGCQVDVRILHVDAGRQRLGLSLKLHDDLVV